MIRLTQETGTVATRLSPPHTTASHCDSVEAAAVRLHCTWFEQFSSFDFFWFGQSAKIHCFTFAHFLRDQTSDLVGLWARNAAMAKYHRVFLVILLLQARLWCKRKLRDLETGYSQPCQPRVKADTKTCFSSFFPIWHLFWCSLTKEPTEFNIFIIYHKMFFVAFSQRYRKSTHLEQSRLTPP